MKKNRSLPVRALTLYGVSLVTTFFIMLGSAVIAAVYSFITGKTVKFPFHSFEILAGEINGVMQGIEFHYSNSIWYLLVILPVIITALLLLGSMLGKRNKGEKNEESNYS